MSDCHKHGYFKTNIIPGSSSNVWRLHNILHTEEVQFVLLKEV